MADIFALNWNTIEFHYWFDDESHAMDAIVFNKCEYEFLGIAKEIAQKLKVELEIETEPLGEGGLQSRCCIVYHYESFWDTFNDYN